MTDESYELAVALESEGADQTQDDIEQVEEQFDETTESIEGSADSLEALAARFRGAAGAIVAGLATATAGLLSRVPVVKETGNALGAVLDAVLLKIDEDLRPVLSDLNEDLLELAGDIDESEGTFEALELAFLGIVEAVDDLETDVFNSLIEKLTGFDPPDVVVDVALNVITLDFLAVIQDTIAGVQEFLRDTDLALPDFNLGELVATEAVAALTTFADFRESLVETGKLAIAGLRTAFEVGFGLIVRKVKTSANSILDAIESTVNRAVRALNRLPRFDLPTVSIGQLETRSRSDIISSGRQRLQRRAARIRGGDSGGGRTTDGGTNDQLRRLIEAMRSTRQEFAVELDSAEIARETKPFLDDGVGVGGRGNIR